MMDIDVDAIVGWISLYAFNIIGALLIFIVGKWLARRIADLLAKLLGKNNVDLTLVNFLTNLAYYTMVVLVVVAAVGRLGVNTTSFLTIIGAAGLAVGLALKDSLSNFAAGVMLVLFLQRALLPRLRRSPYSTHFSVPLTTSWSLCRTTRLSVTSLPILTPRIPDVLIWLLGSATRMT
jgi:hypothetical protein